MSAPLDADAADSRPGARGAGPDAGAAPAPRPGLSRRRKLLYGLATALALLGALELGCRVHYYGRWPYHLLFDAELVWAHRPHWEGYARAEAWARFDALGLRREGELPAAKERPRLLVIGDSIAFGYGLQGPETIAARLNAALPGVEVINGGVSGYGPEQETVWLRRIGPRVQPDRVLLFFCMSNDVSVEPIASHLERRTLFGPGRKSLAVRSQTLRALFDRSAFAFMLGRKVNRWQTKRERAAAAVAHPQQGLRFSNLADFDQLPLAAQRRELAVLRGHLRAFKAACQELGAPAPGLVVFPSEELVAGRGEDQVARVVALGRELGLPTLDLLPLYRRYPRDRAPLLRDRDGIHPTAAGAAWIAEQLLVWQRAEGLLPPR